MSVTVVDPVSPGYAPNGVTTAFAFAFKVSSASELEVVQLLNGVVTVISPAAYSVVLDADGEGGTVNMGVAPLTGTGTVYIYSKPALTQSLNLGNSGLFTPSVLNGALDRQAVASVYLNFLLKRSLKVPFNETGPAYPSVSVRAGYYLTHDDSGNLVQGISTADMAAIIAGGGGGGATNPNYTYAINTLTPGSNATLAASGVYPNILLTFGIPRGSPGASGALSDADYGDIVVSGTGSVLTIDAKAVTYAKMQDASAGNVVLARAAGTAGSYSEVALAASQLLGRGATGNVAAIILGTGLSMSGTTLNATGSDPFTYSNLTADFTGTSITLESTGLAATGFGANKYYSFEADVTAYASAGTWNIGLVWPANVTGTAIIQAVNGSTSLPAGGNQSATVVTAGINSSTATPVRISGHFYSGATLPTGNLEVQVKGNSVSNTHTVQKGSFLRVREI